MADIPDDAFEASIDQYERQTAQFRQILDARTEEVNRDDYVLDQHTRGKRMKVVLRKASKKLKMPELAPESPTYPQWLDYYKNLITLIVSDMKIEAYYKNKAALEAKQKNPLGKGSAK